MVASGDRKADYSGVLPIEEDAMTPPPDPGAAITLTRQLLDRRSARYRSLVVVISLVGFAAPAVALASWQWRPLLGWLLVPVLTCLFLVLDARSVARWRSDILDGWLAGTIDLDAFRDGLSAIKVLPARTIASLVDPLPTRARLECFPDPKPLIREALATTVRAIDGCLVWRTVAAVLVLTATVALLASAALLGSVWPLVGLPLAVGLNRFTRRIGLQPPWSWVRRVAELKSQGLDAPAFAQLARQLAWEPLPAHARERWLYLVGSG